jgi:hypothetical protein
MTRLQCGCRSSFGDFQCAREATQEDLLCDECRNAAGADSSRNGVLIPNDGPDAGQHTHVRISGLVLGKL